MAAPNDTFEQINQLLHLTDAELTPYEKKRLVEILNNEPNDKLFREVWAFFELDQYFD